VTGLESPAAFHLCWPAEDCSAPDHPRKAGTVGNHRDGLRLPAAVLLRRDVARRVRCQDRGKPAALPDGNWGAPCLGKTHCTTVRRDHTVDNGPVSAGRFPPQRSAREGALPTVLRLGLLRGDVPSSTSICDAVSRALSRASVSSYAG